MNRYEPSSFRPAFGVAAVALSAVTLALAVVLPVGLCGGCDEGATFAANAPGPIAVRIDPAHVEVVGPAIRTVVLEPVSVVARRGSVRT